MEKKELYESPATVVVVLMSKSFICQQSMQTYFKGGYGIVNELDDEEEGE